LDLSGLTGVDLSFLIPLTPFILIFGGFVAASKFMGFLMKGRKGKVLGSLDYLGFAAGILLLATGVIVLLEETWSIDVWVLLFVTGLGLVLRILTRISFSALMGLVAGLVCVGLVYLFFPIPETVLGVSSLWVYLAVFLVPALLAYLMFKFFEDLARLFGLILGSWPVLTVTGFLCIAQGILLLLGNNLLSLLTQWGLL
jgi:hypothetical protein